ncbi:uncharacterized protein PHALS_04526 [Plasmopara halstedii]|uniref:Uncharacterized protein n=1 Tax=Plasmopara halstedii TaxID=4781 RepID=A0A0P1A9D9_PLAHL|nr:uncharacterized protein PHALS_04526 [Plasmopara halstedii]CEG37065.1 hypothetical protein PHALS_04526 [Plasmopara halstedii]|eukprot:XP_024573434.1 hypothetical protein PHALS_04526 [Plasmopara halstedii]
MKIEEDVSATATTSAGEVALSKMNAAFARSLYLVCPPIQYPPHCRFNPVRDAADTAEIGVRLEEFFLHAKQLEQVFMNETINSLSSVNLESFTEERAQLTGGRQQRSELELEILNLEAELAEKIDLIEKYTEVVRGWEGKFKRLDNRLSPDRE